MMGAAPRADPSCARCAAAPERVLTLPRPAPLQDGHTPLHCASENGHAGMAEVLIKAGADLNAKDIGVRGCKHTHTHAYICIRI